MTVECNQMTDLVKMVWDGAYSQGVIGGIQEAARILRDQSANAYKTDRDAQAELFRDMARHLEQHANFKDDKWREDGGELEQMERARAEIDARIAYNQQGNDERIKC